MYEGKNRSKKTPGKHNCSGDGCEKPLSGSQIKKGITLCGECQNKKAKGRSSSIFSSGPSVPNWRYPLG